MAPTSSSKKNPSISCISTQFSGNRDNPFSRNSEISNPLRKSFSGSPLGRPSPITSTQRGGGASGGGVHPNTPLHSPSSYPRRHSIGRDSFVLSRHDSEDKENPKDQSFKAAKARSPVSVTKGAKNFMSPTISASSKINSSPRKKILVDSNKPNRILVPFSDSKSLFNEELDSKAEKDTSQKKEVSFSSTVTYLEDQDESLTGGEDSDTREQKGDNYDLDDLPEILSMEKDLVNLDPSFRISPGAPNGFPSPDLVPANAEPSVQSPHLAPLDADPLMPPYDPETNYLSPRPRFLHYRPNPRIELYCMKRDGKQLEESFSLESSDTEVVSEEETDSESLQKGSEDSSSDDALKTEETEEEQKEETEEQEQLLVSELNHTITTEATTNGKMVSKPHFVTKSKLLALLLLLVVGLSCVSVSQSPIVTPFVLNNLNFHHITVPPEITELRRNHVDALALELWIRLHHCYNYITGLFSILQEQHKLEALRYANLTVLSKDDTPNNSVFDHRYSEAEVIREEETDVGVGSPELEDQPTEIDELVVDHLTEIEENPQEFRDNDQEQLEEELEEVVTVSMELGLMRPAEVYTTQHCQVGEPGFAEEKRNNEMENPVSTVALPGVADFELQALPQTEVLMARQLEDLSDISSIDEAEESLRLDTIVSNDLQSSKSSDPSISGLAAIFQPQLLVGIGFLALSLITAYFSMKTKNSKRSAAASPLSQIPGLDKVDKPPSLSPEEHKSEERPASRICHTDMDMVGESCPPPTSSFHNNSYNSKKGLTLSGEAQSQEKKPRKHHRRESLASSDFSTDSPSYGSFTYEKITSKHGNGEQQVITPVRRSSRIRNLVTSP